MTNKVIVLRDTVNGKRRVVETSVGAQYCNQCAIVPLRGDTCEMYHRGLEFNIRTFGVSCGYECSFKDVFEPEDL